MAPRPNLQLAPWPQRLRSGALLVALVVLLGGLTAAGLAVTVVVGAAALDRALG
jgi:hypothetical protein